MPSLAAIIVAGAVAQWLAWRVGLPSILLLLVLGFVVGPVTGIVDPDAMFGDLLMPGVSIAVALILYEGGLTLKLRELADTGHVIRNLVTTGAGVTWIISAAAAHFIFGFDLILSVLVGAILVVTGPTVIAPLLRHIRPSGSVGSILKWEGIVIDPIGALLTVLVFEAFGLGLAQEAGSQIARSLLVTVVAGGGLGVLAAAVLTLLLTRYWVPEFLQNAVSLMLVVAAFAVSNSLQHESGLFAVTVMGIVLANQKFADIKHIVQFKENLQVLLISALFIVLAARVDPHAVASIGWQGVAFVLVLVLIARPAAVLVSTAGAKLNRGERMFLAWMAPRGIVAAAIAAVFALRLEEHNHPDASLLVPVVFIAIIGTVAVYGLTAPLLAYRLEVAVRNPQGVLFAGAHRWARAFAKALKEKGIRVLLVDTNRENIKAARMEGLATYNGSIVSDSILQELDLGGIGKLLAVTPNNWVNVLAVQRFLAIFGRANCYQLAPGDEAEGHRNYHKHLQGRWLFGSKHTYSALVQRLGTGATIKVTKLTESFGYTEFRQMYGESAIDLCRISEDGQLYMIVAEEEVKYRTGQTLISLVYEPEDERGTTGGREP